MGKDPQDENVIAKALDEMDDKIFSTRLAQQMKKSFYSKEDEEIFDPKYVTIVNDMFILLAQSHYSP
jgi:hypothetical protein